jgi:hypothetical protein
MLDQLRWCALECQIPCLKKLAAEAKSKAVRDVAEMVAKSVVLAGEE